MKKHVKKILLSASLVLSLGSACFLNVFAEGGVVIPLSNGDHLVFNADRSTYIVHESSESIQITPYLAYDHPSVFVNAYWLNDAHFDEKTCSLIIPKK